MVHNYPRSSEDPWFSLATRFWTQPCPIRRSLGIQNYTLLFHFCVRGKLPSASICHLKAKKSSFSFYPHQGMSVLISTPFPLTDVSSGRMSLSYNLIQKNKSHPSVAQQHCTLLLGSENGSLLNPTSPLLSSREEWEIAKLQEILALQFPIAVTSWIGDLVLFSMKWHSDPSNLKC